MFSLFVYFRKNRNFINFFTQFANKSGGHKTLINDDLIKPKAINIMHISKQPILRENSCQSLNCSYICVLSYKKANCLCPTGMLKNGSVCIGKLSKISFQFRFSTQFYSKPANFII